MCGQWLGDRRATLRVVSSAPRSSAEASFDAVITDVDELRRHYRHPTANVVAKQIDHVDAGVRAFVGASPFVLIATFGPDSKADVSPRGGHPGFVKVLDDGRLVVPDLNGNNRLDSLQNIITTGRIGMLFMIPGLGETLRVNGTAVVTTDDAILDIFVDEFRRPTSAIGVVVDEAFIHCAKAIRRSSLWQPEGWPPVDGRPSPAQIFVDHCGLDGVDAAEFASQLEASYAAELAHDAPV